MWSPRLKNVGSKIAFLLQDIGYFIDFWPDFIDLFDFIVIFLALTHFIGYNLHSSSFQI